MARIQAGSTLVNQYTPPFVVSDSVADGWELAWNSTLQAFEAVDPTANIVQAGFSAINSALFLDATQQVFVVPFIPDITKTITEQKASFIVTIQGVKQHQDAYTIIVDTTSNTTRVTLDENVTNEDVEVIGLLTDSNGGSVELHRATGDGATTDFTLSWLAPSEQSLFITINGQKVDTNLYSIAPNDTLTATTVSFVTAPAINDSIEIIGIQVAGETPASPVTINNAYGADAGSVFGVYGTKTLSGDEQIFSLKSLEAGTGITITDNTNRLTIDATGSITPVVNLGTNDVALVPDVNASPLEIRGLSGDTSGRIDVTAANATSTAVIEYNFGYSAPGAAATITLTTQRLVHVQANAGGTEVRLPDPSTVSPGDTITIKDDGVGNPAVDNITITTPLGGQIQARNNGALGASHVISTSLGYVTLYTNGVNYYIISEG